MVGNPLGNLQFVPGLGYVQPSRSDEQARAALGDDSTVMMISGLGADAAPPAAVAAPATAAGPGASAGPSSLLDPSTIPWWGWLLIGVALGALLMKWKGKE